MTWRVRVRDVRRHSGALRWSVAAWTSDLSTMVFLDTTESGLLLDIQSDEYTGTSGNQELDELACEAVHVEEVVRIVAVAVHSPLGM